MPVTGTSIAIRSADGVPIAVWVEGSGPPLVLVHGALSDHRRFDTLVAELRAHLTTFAMDRRGRGGSGDSSGYAIEREFEDVAAVVDAVAARTGRPAALWGHSYGADCAMGAAALTGNVDGLILYEPGLGFSYPPRSIEAVEAAVAAGDSEAALLAVLVGVVEATPDEVSAIRASPTWAARLATVPTVARELRAERDWVYEPGCFDVVGASTLVLAGSDSPPSQQDATRRAAAAIPGARVEVLEGHGHFAFQTDPALVAGVIRDFVS